MFAIVFGVMKKMKNNEGKDGKRRYGRLTWREDSTSDLARLRKLVYAGAKLRCGELKDCVVDRLEFELESIEGFGRTAYMLMAAEVAEAIRNAGGRPYGSRHA